MYFKKTSPIRLACMVALIGLTSSTTWAMIRLPEKVIQCQEMDFESVLNSNHIHFEPRYKNLQAFDIEVDRTVFKTEELYLNYIRKTCPPDSVVNPQECRFDFAIYRVLPDNSIGDSTEFLAFDFKNRKITHDKMIDGKLQSQDSALPENCLNLGNEYLQRENQLNEAYKNKK